MIINSLFPTASTNGTQDVGYTSGQFQCKRTAACNSVDVDMSTFASAYYLGWANPNNLPKAFWLSHCYETETEYVFECIEPSENFMIGFCTMSESVPHAGYRQYTGQTAETTALDSTRLINDLYPEFVGATATNYNIVLNFMGFFSEPGSLHVNNYNGTINTSNTTSDSEKINNYNQWLRYKNGEFKLKFNAPSSYGTYEIGYSDISSTGRIVTTTSTGVNVTLYYKGFTLNGNRKYNGSATSGWNIMPFIVQEGSFEDPDVAGGKEFRAVRGSYYNNWAAYYQPSTGNLPGTLIPTAYSSFGAGYDNCVVKKEDIPMGSMNIFDYVDYTTMLLVRISAYNYQFFPVGDINDIDAFFGLLPRLIRIPSNADVASYQDGLTYAPDVSANDEFLCRIKTGNISDESFKAGLRKWQYVDWEEYAEDPTKPQGIQENEFEEEDAPEYDPTPPTPPTPGTDIPDDENPEPLNPGEKGDEGNVEKNTSVPNAISAFTTSYIMTELEVSSFGNRLWTSVQNEPNAQRNFFTITDDTATYELTNSNIIDYLVSLKWYPFSITQYCNFSTWSAYLIGSGTYAYTGAAYVAEDAVGYIPGGSVNIPWSTNTFVDLEPYTSVSFYIPFCGTIDVPASKVRGRRVTLDYYVDYITGGCTAYLTVPTANGSFPVASINGTLGFDMLVTGNNAQVIAARAYQQNNERRLREIEGLGGAIVDALGGLVSSAQSGGGSKSGSSRDYGSVGGITSIAKSIGSAAFSEIQGKLSQGTIQGTSPLTLGSASTLSGLGYIKPFAAVTSRVFFNNGTGYDKVGYISNKPLAISSIKDGVFFNCINPELKNIGATNSELAQITSMLSSGVYK